MSLPSDAFRHVASRPHEPLRTFHPRRAVLGRDREDALRHLWPRLGFSVHDPDSPMPRTLAGALDTVALFGRDAPLVLEIGSGMGETTVAMAAADPDRDYLAVEAHLPGIANLLGLVDGAGLANVRVAHGDALDLARSALPEESLDAVHVFFPDPWPQGAAPQAAARPAGARRAPALAAARRRDAALRDRLGGLRRRHARGPRRRPRPREHRRRLHVPTEPPARHQVRAARAGPGPRGPRPRLPEGR